ncbi:Hypothetical predicted protein, partial [Paramuricea clavata]
VALGSIFLFNIYIGKSKLANAILIALMPARAGIGSGVKYNNHSIRNYFHRVRANTLKDFGKTNGVCNSNNNIIKQNVISFTKHNKQFLEQALQGFELDDVTIN